MDITELREQIDQIDHDLVELYRRRMETARAIGRYKREHHLPVMDSEREKILLNKVAEQAGKEYKEGILALYRLLLEQSRMCQELDGLSEN